MDSLIQIVFLILCLCVIWAFVKLIRRSSRNNKTLRWLWILGLAISSFLFMNSVLASMMSGAEVIFACMRYNENPDQDAMNSFCATPELKQEVSLKLWLQAMTLPHLRPIAVCWNDNETQDCRYASDFINWDYYLCPTGISLFFGMVLGFLTWRLTRDTRKIKEKNQELETR